MAELEAKLDRLIEEFGEVKTSLDNIKKGGITVSVKTIGRGYQDWKLQDIIQTLWDRPKDTFDKLADYSGKSQKIISLIKTITMLIIGGMIVALFINNIVK